jgi:thiamine biosynthesis protein ThiS
VRIVFNGQEREITPNATIAELLAELQLTPKLVAVEVNRDVVPRTRHAEHRLQTGDEVEVVTLVGGG